MPRDLSPAFQKNANLLNSPNALLLLLTISSPELKNDVLIVNNTVDIVSRGTTFTAFAFELILPIEDGNNQPVARIKMDNVDRSLIDEIRLLSVSPDFKFELVLSLNPDEVELEIMDLKIRNVTYDKQKINGDLYIEDILNSRFPGDKFAPFTHPGLF